jgi:dTDP-4-dehydrorhamnose 3,5-epimerase
VPFQITPTSLEGVVIIDPVVHGDARGFFLESFKRSAFEALGLPGEFVQANHSRSLRHTVRGLHYQRDPAAQGKLVRCLAGQIFDVVVDVRQTSATFLRSVTVSLSGDAHRMLYVPPWYAHGFCVLSDSADVLYQATAEYSPAHEEGVAWDDPALAIAWPIDRASAVLSERDRNWPRIPVSR